MNTFKMVPDLADRRSRPLRLLRSPSLKYALIAMAERKPVLILLESLVQKGSLSRPLQSGRSSKKLAFGRPSQLESLG
jgi:hypothetical protein